MSTIFILHGTAERDPNYAADLVKNLPGLNVVQGFYGDILQQYENPALEKLQAQPAWKAEHMKTDIRLPVIQFAQDMTYWMNNFSVQDDVSKRLSSQLPNAGSIVHLLFHSFGCMVGFCYLYLDVFQQTNDIRSITTVGCPLHMYGREVQSNWGPWYNFYHTEDVLSAPLNGLYGCTDHEVKDAGPPTELVWDSGLPFTLAAHNCYFKSMTLAEHLNSLS